MTSRFEAEKFTGKNDFGLWRLKMKAMLIQQGLAEALKVDDPKLKPDQAAEDPKVQNKKAEMLEKGHSAVILCLGDKVLSEVSKDTTAAGILAKLESLYMTKYLANRLYMKQRLYSYTRHLQTSIQDFKTTNSLQTCSKIQNIPLGAGGSGGFRFTAAMTRLEWRRAKMVKSLRGEEGSD